MKTRNYILGIIAMAFLTNCNTESNKLNIEVFETSASGNKLSKLTEFQSSDVKTTIELVPEETFQTITGFGGAFTESSAYLLNKLSKENRDTILKAYFSKEGARYSLTRTHMNSCDFSLSNYSYAPVEDDISLEHFSIQEDKDDLIPMMLSPGYASLALFVSSLDL
mgnify:CR=1 FL=1